jgi:hypothetical protein
LESIFRADVFRADVFRADVFRADVFRADNEACLKTACCGVGIGIASRLGERAHLRCRAEPRTGTGFADAP